MAVITCTPALSSRLAEDPPAHGAVVHDECRHLLTGCEPRVERRLAASVRVLLRRRVVGRARAAA